MSTITWGGDDDSWAGPLGWIGLTQPGANDSAVIGAGTVSLVAAATIDNVTLTASGTGSLLVRSTLTLGGSLTLAGGTLDLSRGTLTGGTLDLTGGTLVGGGGTVDGSRIIGAFGDGLTVTAATIAATQMASASLDVTGALSLAAGSYDGGTLDLNAAIAHGSETLTTAGQVELGKNETLVFSNYPPHDAVNGAATPPFVASVALAIGGDTINRGLIYSNVTSGALILSGGNFQNAGQIELGTVDEHNLTQPQYTTGPHGTRQPTGASLHWTETWTPKLLITAASFDNTGTIHGSGATLSASGAVFTNEGMIAFVDADTETAVVTGKTDSIGTVTLASVFSISAGVTTFDNTGSIAAGTITFNDNLTLAELGGLTGHIVFAGTLDLQGDTLQLGDFGAGSSVSFSGTVENGTIVTQGVAADFSGTQISVTTLAMLPVTLVDITSGAVTLDAVTSELAYTTAATIDNLSVTAGAAGTIDKIGARVAGTLTFGADTTITDTVAGSTLEIGGIGNFADNGRIVVDTATVEIATTLDGGGTVSLADGAKLSIRALARSATTTIVFGAGHNLLNLPSDLSGTANLRITLVGLAAGDLIDFAGVSANVSGGFGQPGAVMSNGTLDVQGGTGTQASVTLGDATTGLTFTVSSDTTGGTLVTVACFRAGTRIAVAGGERAVERLRIGDRVRTASGALRPIKWLGHRCYPAATVAAQRQLRPVRIMAGALGQGLPRRDLFVSPLHAMLIDGVLVPAAAIVNATSITRAPIAAVSYVHIELDSPDIILAEGAPTETFVDCDSRAMFDNAREFALLYPDAPDQRWAFPVPRIEEGWQLASIRHRLAAAAAAPPAPGTLRGSIDRAGDGQIEGWLMDESDPGTPVEFELLAGDRQLDCLVANRYRIDLDRAGLGRGACAFTACLPPEIANGATLRLRRLSDGATLGG